MENEDIGRTVVIGQSDITSMFCNLLKQQSAPDVDVDLDEPPTKFPKREGLDRTSIFRGGLLGKRGWLFSGGLQFLDKK